MQTQRKIQRVQPIIKLKQDKVQEETALLQTIQSRKVEIVRAMRENQKRYMDGVNQLNEARASAARLNLDTLERGLDYVKAQWYKLYTDVQEVERQEKEQIVQVLAVERELKSVEKLREKYETLYKKELSTAEQKMLDELALRRFLNKSQVGGT